MKDIPILFSAPMIRAILDGRKHATRRIAHVNDCECKPGYITPNNSWAPRRIENHIQYCRFKIGQRIWVRETWQAIDANTGRIHRPDLKPSLLGPGDCRIVYKATDADQFLPTAKWRPSIFRPKWASRINLEVTGIRLERLTDISIQDAHDEGIEIHPDGLFNDYMTGEHIDCARESFFSLWESIHKVPPRDDIWVWVIENRRLESV